MKSSLFASVLLLGLVASSRATLLVDTSSGTNLVGDFVGMDDGSDLRSLGGSFSFYGTTNTSIYVQANGFLSPGDASYMSADYTVGGLADLSFTSVIAPFYDDLFPDATLGDSITEGVTSSYYAVSYAVTGYNDIAAGHESVFQAALIKSATTLQGNALLPGDIVLSYGALASTVSDSNFSVGVGASSANATNAFGATGGQFGTATSFLSNFNAATQALLFRYNPTNGSYVQSLITYRTNVTPEPGALAALGLGAIALLRRRRR